MSSDTIAAILTGLTGLIAALATFTASRQRRVTADQRALKRRVRQLERQLVVLVEHTFTLEMEVARHGGRVPARPSILEELDADADDEDPAANRGRHAGT